MKMLFYYLIIQIVKGLFAYSFFSQQKNRFLKRRAETLRNRIIAPAFYSVSLLFPLRLRVYTNGARPVNVEKKREDIARGMWNARPNERCWWP